MRGLLFCFGLMVGPLGTDRAIPANWVIGTPKNLGSNINTPAREAGPTLSRDGLSLYFTSDRLDGYGGVGDIWVSTRETTNNAWGPATNLGPLVNSPACEASPSISADGLTLFFCDGHWWLNAPQRPGGQGDVDLWMTTRATTDADWNPPVNLGPKVNSPYWDGVPDISADGLSLYFASNRPGGSGLDIYVATRATTHDDWNTPVNLGPLNSLGGELDPSISTDGRILFFSTNGSNTAHWDLWMTKRRTQYDVWEPPVALGPVVNTGGIEGAPEISTDDSALYFTAYQRPGGIGDYDLWEAPVLHTPLLDFNGSGQVDIGDLVQLVEGWGQENPLLDIAPPPFSDGIVDKQDLAILMSYWGQEVTDPTIVSHWPFDETDGIIAHDLAGGQDGMVMGVPQWWPQGGRVDGALELNGTTSVVANFAMGSGGKPFSILAWIKGGECGQTVVSQEGKANWLLTDAQGALMTELSTSDRVINKLTSEEVITEGGWHRIALTWNGVSRRLYVDSTLVAEDLQDSLGVSQAPLIFGADKHSTPGQFWSGLIDDVRIYNRAVKP